METYKGFNKDMTAKMAISMKKERNTKRKRQLPVNVTFMHANILWTALNITARGIAFTIS